MHPERAKIGASSPRLLHHLLEGAARAWPEREAMVCGRGHSSYRDLDEGANRIAHALLRAGVGRGERVGILMPNGARFASGYFAIAKMGGVAVPINTAATPAHLGHVLRDAGVSALLLEGRAKPERLRVLSEAPALRVLFAAGDVSRLGQLRRRDAGFLRSLDGVLEEESPERPEREVSPRDLACLAYTSGSTGRPKGVMLRHANIVANTESIASCLDLRPDDRMMVVLPFFYCYGASLIHTHFRVGASLVIENQFTYPNRVLERMEEERVTGFAGVPSTFAILLRRSSLRERSLEHLRCVTQAGGAMAPALIRELREALPGARIHVMYGQTEASARLSCLPPELLDEKIGSIGRGIPGVELRVLGPDGERVRPAQVGEIVATGPNVMAGYWGCPEATRTVLDAEGLHTGDLARVDEDGFIYIVGRKRDIINCNAHRISAGEIEEAILEEASVLECAVVGVEDEIAGEAICAFVVPVDGGGIGEREILRACKERLPAYQVPRSVEICRSLPRNEAGKILKEELRRQAQEGQRVA